MTSLFWVAMAATASAQTFTSLFDFNGTNGANPMTSLVEGVDGNLYGTTNSQGPGSSGTIFRLTRTGKLQTVYVNTCNENTCDLDFLNGLVLASDGNLYGTAIEGGIQNCAGSCGSVFRLSRDGTLTVLHDFDSADGANPRASLIQATDGGLYGTTSAGGTNNLGTVFRITLGGELILLHSFDGDDGSLPEGALIEGIDGNLYGTASAGGSSNCENGCGTVFKISRNGEFKTLYQFCEQINCPDGAQPTSGLAQDLAGNFFGTTYLGGTGPGCISNTGCGTIFEITANGELTTLYSFCSQECTDGLGPTSGVVLATDGNLYGTTEGGGVEFGTLYSLSSFGILATLHTFEGSDGAVPYDSLVQSTDGTFYGTTLQGGIHHNLGTLFQLSVGLSPFVRLQQYSGRVGQTGGILGQGFKGATGVSFNDVPTTFKVLSDTFLRATVPSGASSGYVTVTSSTGTLTSDKPFQVIP